MTEEVRPWDLLDKSNWTNKDKALARWNICLGCEHLDKTYRCDFCGCFMKAKVKLENAICPLYKWR